MQKLGFEVMIIIIIIITMIMITIIIIVISMIMNTYSLRILDDWGFR